LRTAYVRIDRRAAPSVEFSRSTSAAISSCWLGVAVISSVSVNSSATIRSGSPDSSSAPITCSISDATCAMLKYRD
jgi:hypothetical protein